MPVDVPIEERNRWPGCVRFRPSMYLGGTDARGLLAMVGEILDFSLDEFRSGLLTSIIVTLHRDHSITIRDDGAGLRLLAQPDGATVFEKLLTDLHCSQRRTGLFNYNNPPGIWIVNALSSSFTAETLSQGQQGKIRFECGKIVEPLKIEPYSGEDGVVFRFRCDPTIFPSVQFDGATLRQRLWEQAALHPGVRIDFHDESTGTTEQFRSSDGVLTLLGQECRDKISVWPEPLRIEMRQGPFRYDLAIHCVQADCFSYSAFANSLPTREGGAHVVATRDAIATVLRRITRQESTEKLSWPLEELLRGTVIAIAVDVPDAMYEGPTKEKLANHEIEASIRDFVSHSLTNLLARKPDHVRLWRKWITADSR